MICIVLVLFLCLNKILCNFCLSNLVFNCFYGNKLLSLFETNNRYHTVQYRHSTLVRIIICHGPVRLNASGDVEGSKEAKIIKINVAQKLFCEGKDF